jgi:hypothetical protein
MSRRDARRPPAANTVDIHVRKAKKGYVRLTPHQPRAVRFIAPPLSLLLLLGVLAVPAHAWTAPSSDDEARLAQFLPMARAAWPGSPCAGRETIHLHADAALATEAPLVTGNLRDALDGMGAPSTCEVWISSGLTAAKFCTVLVHETGHLAGRGHTDAPGDVMNGEGDIGYEPCDEAVTPPASVAMMDEVRSVLPAPRAEWRISCGPRRGTERRCVARRGAKVRRYFVTQTRTAVSVASAD